jgi:hypothetical protein
MLTLWFCSKRTWPNYVCIHIDLYLFVIYLANLSVTNQNLIQEEIKRRLNSGNACYHSVQNLSSSRLLSNNLKIRIHKTVILSVVLYGYETWSLMLNEGVWEQGAEENIWTEERWSDRRLRKLHNEELHNLYSSPSINTNEWWNQGGWDGQGM